FDTYSGAEDGCAVETTDSTTFYPQGVYVSNSMASYLYVPWSSSTTKGYHKVLAVGYNVAGQVIDTVGVYLEEKETPRFKDWKYLDLSSLGEVKRVKFLLESDYMNQFGLEIDAYFCIDNFVYDKGRRYGNDDFDTVNYAKAGFDTIICANTEFDFNGKQYTSTQIIIDTVKSLINAPDTIYTINLTVKDAIVTYDTVEITSDELPYSFGDLSLEESCDTVFVFMAEDGCDSTVYLHLTVEASIKDIDATASVNIYPNPAVDNVGITLNNLQGAVNITVSNVEGRIIKSIEVGDGSSFVNIPLTDMEKGVYVITVRNEKVRRSIKLIKQ
ncbi:MAG: DUF4465 domain-containing protein, partial [Bacteroidales bacterium]|nr:DUF4465 domain-containing protein [Bacteroidales bacterium]